VSAPRELVAIVGPTATGKSELAMALAAMLGGEIVTVDSAQVFRRLDIGTAKPSMEERARIPHHLIDEIEPDQQWSAAEYARNADARIAEIEARGKVPILCGGTGLWLRALVHGIVEAPEIDPEIRSAVRREIADKGAPSMHRVLAEVDPEAAVRIQPNDPQRIGRALEVFKQVGVPLSRLQASHRFKDDRYRLIAFGIAWPRDALASRIEARTNDMYRRGLVEETRARLEEGISPEAPGLSIIGYKDAVLHVAGELSLDEAIARTAAATRQYAKRQRNWFRGVREVEWVDEKTSPGEVLALLRARLTAV
jgi:tRNA dimethylallyltransferase